MLRNRFQLSDLAGRLGVQVLASVIATLLGSAIFAVLPSASGSPDPHAVVELTSGGKFAARVPGAAQDDEPSAGDSRPASLSGTAGALYAASAMAMLPPMSSDAAAVVAPGDAAADQPSRGRTRPTRQSALRHRLEAAPVPLARPTTLPAIDTGSAAPDEGMLPKLVSSARSLWSVSASTGAAFVSRLVP